MLQLHNIHFAHGAQSVLHGVSLELPAGEVLVIVGPSGCGKSTLLRLIAGLERPGQGSVVLDGHTLCDAHTFVVPEQRPVGMVFQGLALFPHLTVRQNVDFGLQGMPRSEREQRVSDELRGVGLEELATRFPHQLSGGQQQRVAIARALVRRPRLLLMDEPFSDLDPRTRRTVREEVKRILRAHGIGAIIVTHDREDAWHLADRIAEMDNGRIERMGAADELRQAWTVNPFNP